MATFEGRFSVYGPWMCLRHNVDDVSIVYWDGCNARLWCASVTNPKLWYSWSLWSSLLYLLFVWICTCTIAGISERPLDRIIGTMIGLATSSLFFQAPVQIAIELANYAVNE